MKDKEKIKAVFPNCVPLRGKHQWKIVSFVPPQFYPRTLGRAASKACAWASAVHRQKV